MKHLSLSIWCRTSLDWWLMASHARRNFSAIVQITQINTIIEWRNGWSSGDGRGGERGLDNNGQPIISTNVCITTLIYWRPKWKMLRCSLLYQKCDRALILHPVSVHIDNERKTIAPRRLHTIQHQHYRMTMRWNYEFQTHNHNRQYVRVCVDVRWQNPCWDC